MIRINIDKTLNERDVTDNHKSTFLKNGIFNLKILKIYFLQNSTLPCVHLIDLFLKAR